MSLIDEATMTLFKPLRRFGEFRATVVIDEDAEDEAFISRHPVEIGPRATDNAFMEPTSLKITMGWTNSVASAIQADISQIPAILATGGDLTSLFGNVTLNNSTKVYAGLLALMRTLTPFTIVTGKRRYPTMLIQHLSVPTNSKTENALIVTARCKEIILVQTRTVLLGNTSVQDSPEITAPTQNLGTQQLQSAPSYNPGSIISETLAALPGL